MHYSNLPQKPRGLNLSGALWYRCITTPANCRMGQTRTCKQEVSVLHEHENHNKLVNLRFYYTVSSTDHDGFIDRDNEPLQLLIRRGIINPDLLVDI
jgi:hypothetical protein